MNEDLGFDNWLEDRYELTTEIEDQVFEDNADDEEDDGGDE